MFVEQARGDVPRGVVGFAKGQAAIAIDEEVGILVLVAVIREIVRQAGRGILEQGHGRAVAREIRGFRGGPRGSQLVHDRIERGVELCRHRVFFPLQFARSGALAPGTCPIAGFPQIACYAKDARAESCRPRAAFHDNSLGG